MERSPRRSRLPLAAAAAALALLHSPQPVRAQAFSGVAAWSSVGATGVADESSTAIVAFDNTGGAGVKPAAPAGSIAILRYPVSFLPSHWYVVNIGSYHVLDRLKLTMSFRKPDEGSYAFATLKRMRLSDGVVSSVASVSSLAAIPAAAVQQDERTVSCGEDVPCINPYEYAYYVEVVLWKPEGTNNPQVLGLRIHTLSI